MKTIVSAIALIAAMTVATSAQAALTVYTDKAAFLAAAGSTKVEDFSSAPVGNFASTYSNSYNGFTASGTTNGNNVGITTTSLSNNGDDAPVPGSFEGQNFFGWGDGGPGDTIGNLTLTFTVPTTAFGFDWFDTDGSDQYQVSLNPGGDTFSGPPFTLTSFGPTNSGFWGVISDTALTSAILSNQQYGGYISTEGFDNVITSADVPEPAMLGLFGLGALGLGLARRRKAA